MNPYSGFASIYDAFMKEAPRQEWLNWVVNRWPDLAGLDMADLGCGTGALTVELASRCRQMYGVDQSEEMLSQAAQAAQESRSLVKWFCQDVRELKLPAPVDIMLATCDVLNYLPTEADLSLCFERVMTELRPGGWFCFDVLGPSRVMRLKNGLWHDIQDDAAILFETDYDEGSGVITYDVHMFVSEDGKTYERYEEQHTERYYPMGLLGEMLSACHLKFEVMGDFGRSSVEQADRLCIAAQKSP